MKDLIIHIGLPKTGTTTIQNSLKKNMQLLSQQGVSYFDLNLSGNPINDSLWCNLLYVGEVSDGRIRGFEEMIKRKNDLPSLEDSFSKIYSEVGDKVVMSSEFMSSTFHKDKPSILDMSSVREVVSYCNSSHKFRLTQIILYIRRQDSYYNSMVNQSIKMHWIDPRELEVPDFYEKLNHMNDYLKQNSPATKFDVRNFDLAKKKGLERDFYNSIQVDSFEPLNEVVNTGVTAEELLLCMSYKDLGTPVESWQDEVDYGSYTKELNLFTSSVSERKVVFLTKKEQRDLLDQVYEENKALFEKFNMGSSKEFEDWMVIKPEAIEAVYFDLNDLALNKSAMELLLKAFFNLGQRIIDNDLKVLACAFLNILRYNKGKRIYIYGCGEHTRHLLQKVDVSLEIAGIIDLAPTSIKLLGFCLHKADEFDYSKADIVIISSKVFEEEINIYLKTKISEDKIVTLYSTY